MKLDIKKIVLKMQEIKEDSINFNIDSETLLNQALHSIYAKDIEIIDEMFHELEHPQPKTKEAYNEKMGFDSEPKE